MDEPAKTDEAIFGENIFCAQISGDCGAKPAKLVRNRLGEGGTGELGAVAKDMFGDKNGEDTGGDVGGDK